MAAPTVDPPLRPPPPKGSSTGALWTAGLGAFLLIAAAATWVAVHWDAIPDQVKLGTLIVVSDVCVLAQRRLRATLPITATVLFHLGVLLVPIDVAAVGVHLGWSWSEMLLAQGLAATVTFGIAAWTERSVVLRVAAWGGVVGLAAGLGGTSGAPAGLVLAGLALAATLAHGRVDGPRGDGRRLGLEWGAAGWAALAGLAVPLSGAQELGWPAAGVLTDLGLAGAAPHPTAAATGLVAGLALVLTAHRRRSLPVAFVALACALTGLVTTWVGLEPSGPASLAATAALLLVVQVGGWVWRNDAFWQRPTELLAQGGEALTAVLTLRLAGELVLAPDDPFHDPTTGLAATLVALTWLIGEARVQQFAVGRPGAFWLDRCPLAVSAALAPLGAAVAASAAVALLSGSALATAVALTVSGGAAVVLAPVLSASWPARGDTHQILAAHLLAWAPFVAEQNRPLVAVLALAGALAIAEGAVGITRTRGGMSGRVAPAAGHGAHGAPGAFVTWPGVPGSGVTRPTALVLTLLALVPIASGALVLAARDAGTAAAAGVVVAAWLVAAMLDRAVEPSGTVPLAIVPRIAGLVPLAFLPLLPNHAEAAIAGLVAGLAVADAVRRDEPLLLTGAGAALPFAVLGLAGHAGWSAADAGVIVTLAGVAWLGLGACLPPRWAPPMVVSAIGAAGAGLVLSLDHPPALATNMLLVGGTVAAVGLTLRLGEVTTIGLVVATIGFWTHLQLAEVTVSEPYVAPVALLLLVAGIQAQRAHGVSSWLAHAPSVVLLGGAALLERLDGGSAWHALVAGAVGAVAVAAGGARRLAGPLLVGTLLVVATTIHETLGVTSAVGTPVWLAAGGLALLAAGVTMERRGVGPVEAGRRLIDVVNERFA
jgi:hypothetical protein